MKLSLNKIRKGHYEKTSGDFKVVVEKMAWTGYWKGTVEQCTRTAKDFSGNWVKCYDVLFEWKSLTKREASEALVNWIENN